MAAIIMDGRAVSAAMLSDPRTWTTLAYLLLMLPLGMLVAGGLLAAALGGPLLE